MIDWQAHILKMDGLIVKNEVQGFIQTQKQTVVLNVLVAVFEAQMDELHDHYVLQELVLHLISQLEIHDLRAPFQLVDHHAQTVQIILTQRRMPRIEYYEAQGFYSVSGEPVWHTIWGDGLRVGSEQWDDGNANPNDGCSNLCTIETGYVCQGGTNHSPDKWDIVWGDWIIISPETWDDWNRYSGDGWSATCQLESVKKIFLND